MIVFDSTKNYKWSGRGFKLEKDRIVVLKSAVISQKLRLSHGNYSIKIIGKKRSGDGAVSLKVTGEDSVIILDKSIMFSTSSWSEYVVQFKVEDNSSIDFSIIRDSLSFGSIEIGRLIVEKHDFSISIAGSKNEVENNKLNDKLNDKDKFIYTSIRNDKIIRKIAFVVPYSIYGGAEIYIQEIINNISDKPFDITIIYMQQNKLKLKINNNSVRHTSFKSLDNFHGILKSEAFEYIIYYNSKNVYNILSDFKNNGNIKSKLIEIYHSDFQWADALSTLKDRSNVHCLISVADSLANDITGINTREVIPVGIDLSRFKARAKSNILNITPSLNGRIIGTVARLSKEKNLNYICDLALAMPNDTFVIVGEGPEYTSLSNRKIPNIIFAGFHLNVEDYYSVFDAFVLPSKIEGTPISILEAMASGVPVCAANVGAISDIIIDGSNGYFLTMDLSKDVIIILNSINQREIISSAKKYVEFNHDIKKNANAFCDLILNSNNYFAKTCENDKTSLIGEFI